MSQHASRLRRCIERPTRPPSQRPWPAAHPLSFFLTLCAGTHPPDTPVHSPASAKSLFSPTDVDTASATPTTTPRLAVATKDDIHRTVPASIAQLRPLPSVSRRESRAAAAARAPSISVRAA